jgi:hypothetical protein
MRLLNKAKMLWRNQPPRIDRGKTIFDNLELVEVQLLSSRDLAKVIHVRRMQKLP